MDCIRLSEAKICEPLHACVCLCTFALPGTSDDDTELSIHMSIHMSINMSIHMSIHMSRHMSIHMSIHIASCLAHLMVKQNHLGRQRQVSPRRCVMCSKPAHNRRSFVRVPVGAHDRVLDMKTC